MISATPQSPTLLEGYPLYWVPRVEFKKPRGLEVMAPYERKLCGLFLGAKYNSARLIKHEFDVLALKKYIGRFFFFHLLGYLHIFMHACIYSDLFAQLPYLTLPSSSMQIRCRGKIGKRLCWSLPGSEGPRGLAALLPPPIPLLLLLSRLRQLKAPS